MKRNFVGSVFAPVLAGIVLGTAVLPEKLWRLSAAA